jgi:hypothetical protein
MKSTPVILIAILIFLGICLSELASPTLPSKEGSQSPPIVVIESGSAVEIATYIIFQGQTRQ